jgi:hypothetical protein
MFTQKIIEFRIGYRKYSGRKGQDVGSKIVSDRFSSSYPIRRSVGFPIKETNLLHLDPVEGEIEEIPHGGPVPLHQH